MRRREFITLIGGAAAWPLGAWAQKAPLRIGFLVSGAATSLFVTYKIDLIKKGLSDNGLIEGRDYLLEVRFAAGKYDRFPELARELAQAGVSVVLANTPASVLAAQRLAPPVPVVMVAINDPVGAGLVASLAQPGGQYNGYGHLEPRSDAQNSRIRTHSHSQSQRHRRLNQSFKPDAPGYAG